MISYYIFLIWVLIFVWFIVALYTGIEILNNEHWSLGFMKKDQKICSIRYRHKPRTIVKKCLAYEKYKCERCGYEWTEGGYDWLW